MAIETNGRFVPSATKGALELFSATDMTRALTKLDCGLVRDQIAQISMAYELLFTPATVRRSRNGLVRERLMKKVQEVFTATRQTQAVASACEHLYAEVLDVRDGDWTALHVRLAVSLGMDPEAVGCAHAVLRWRREQGKRGEDAAFASEQFNEMWSKSDRAALEGTCEFESTLRDVAKTCIAVAHSGALCDFKATDDRERRALFKSGERGAGKRSFGATRVEARA